MSNETAAKGGIGLAAGIHCRPAMPGEMRPALGMMLGPPGRGAPENQIQDFVRFAAQRNIDLNHIMIAEAGGRMLWAVLPIVSPGRTMLLLSPTRFPAAPDPAAGAAAQLTDLICRDYGQREIHLAQVLIDPAESATREMYAQVGFVEMAELIYLHGNMPRSGAAPILGEGMFWQNYSPRTHELFARTISETYIDSLDCPALSGLRQIEDVIAGHKATGDFDPGLWFLLGDGRGAMGVLLLTRSGADLLEVVYVGLIPSARGRGIGKMLMQQAAACVVGNGRSRLSLAVDSRNTPALKLYYQYGLGRFASKVAMLRDLRSPPQLQGQFSTFFPHVP